MQTFYNGVTQPLRSTIDAVAGGTLINKIEDEAYNIIEEMALNNSECRLTEPNPSGLDIRRN